MANGLKITVPGADVEAYSPAFSADAPSGLIGLFFLNGSLEKACRNLADPSKPGVVVGEPVVASGFMQFKSGSNFLNTALFETNDMTIMSACRSLDTLADDAHRPMYVSNFRPISVSGKTSYGVSLYASGTNIISQSRSRENGSGGTTSTPANIASNDNAAWALYCGRVRTDRVELNNLTTNVSAQSAVSQPRWISPEPMRIGSSYAPAYTGTSEIAVVGIWNRWLENDEVYAMEDQLRAYLARRFSIAV